MSIFCQLTDHLGRSDPQAVENFTQAQNDLLSAGYWR